MSESYRGRIKGQSVVLLETAAPLPDGTWVLVTPMSPQPGTAEALLAAVKAEPHLTKEDIDALEQSIEEGDRISLERLYQKAIGRGDKDVSKAETESGGS